jgi:hypothetical protein
VLAGLRSRLTYANVMATIAVFIALGGGAMAAFKLPANSVKSRNIKDGNVKLQDLASPAVNGSKVFPDSLGGEQIDESTLGEVPSAASAESADMAGNADTLDGKDSSEFQATNLFAYVRDPGAGAAADALIQYGKGATSVVEPQPATDDGVYDVTFDRSVANCVAQAQPGMGDPQGPVALPGSGWTTFTGLAADPGNDPNVVRVVTTLPGFGARDASFQIVVFC